MDFEIDAGLGYDYGCDSTTEFYDLMYGQYAFERDAGTASPSADPGLLWLVFESLARGDGRIDLADARPAMAANRWIPVLYEVDGLPGIGDGSIDDDYDPELLHEDSLDGCRTRLTALLSVIDGPGATQNFDLLALARAIHRRTGGYDPAGLDRDALLRIAERCRRAAH